MGSKETKASTCGRVGWEGAAKVQRGLLLGQMAPAFPSHKSQPRGWIRFGMRVPRKRQLTRMAGEGLDQAAKMPPGLLMQLSPRALLTWGQVEFLSRGTVEGSL